MNLNMIDSVGSGIRRLFVIQRNRCFPLPDFELSNHSVTLTIMGKILDMNYARKLASDKTLALSDIILLDKVQKGKELTEDEFKKLKQKKLIEGRRKNCIISSSVAKITHQESDYMKLRGIEDDYCKKMILDYLKEFGSAKKSDLESFLLEKISDALTETQKKARIKNILQAMRRNGDISPEGKSWKMSK